MPDVLYGGLRKSASATCTTMGSMPGPIGGDGWQSLASLPTSLLQASRHYAFVVSGIVRNIQRIGATPNRGLVQVVLGDESGVKSAAHCFELGVNWPAAGSDDGVPFQFLVVFAPAYSITPPAWGSSWPNSDPLTLYGRTFWNGDPATYACTFEVADVSWLWFDIDAISSTSAYFADEHAPATPLLQVHTGSLQTQHLGPAAPGAAGEKWVHFTSMVFTPLADTLGGGPVVFNHEQTQTGALPGFGEASVGCLSRGAPFNASFRNPTMHFGAFFTRTRQPIVTHRFGYRGDGDALIHRWLHFAVRVDDLPLMSELHLDSEPSTPGPANAPLVLFHEPPPKTIPVAEPIYLAHARADVASSGLFAHKLRLITHHGRVLFDGVPINALAGERVPMHGCDVTGLGTGDGPRYENEIQQTVPATPGVQFTGTDIEFLQVWLLKDPSIDPPEPPEPGDFLVVIPSREGVSIGAQQSLPIDPEWRSESPDRPRAEIRGSTGVRRTWPLFTAPRREWSLVWSALTNTEAASLEAFLRANKTFKGRPPQESDDVALLSLDPPRLQMIDAAGPAWSCSIRVAELIFVGGA